MPLRTATGGLPLYQFTQILTTHSTRTDSGRVTAHLWLSVGRGVARPRRRQRVVRSDYSGVSTSTASRAAHRVSRISSWSAIACSRVIASSSSVLSGSSRSDCNRRHRSRAWPVREWAVRTRFATAHSVDWVRSSLPAGRLVSVTLWPRCRGMRSDGRCLGRGMGRGVSGSRGCVLGKRVLVGYPYCPVSCNYAIELNTTGEVNFTNPRPWPVGPRRRPSGGHSSSRYWATVSAMRASKSTSSSP